jgi:hypothetical protein
MVRLERAGNLFLLLIKWLWYTALRLLCGYGEKPFLTMIWFLTVFVLLALCYYFIGDLEPHNITSCFYYSIVSCTAVGYGDWAPKPFGWVKAMGAMESVVGIFLISLFVATFVRKMTR